MTKNILITVGTRPEVIKLAPVVLKLRQHPDLYNVTLCNTEQQKELSNQALSFFGLTADIKLDAMVPNQTLAQAQSALISKLSPLYGHRAYDATIVQGDTMSVFCGALSSFYNKVPVFHVEAGLRSHNLQEPYPEEGIRQMTARITDLHLCPTEKSRAALQDEGITSEKIHVTGNTVVDALFCLDNSYAHSSKKFLQNTGIAFDKKIVLITAHRRENHGPRLDQIIQAIQTLSQSYPDHQFIIPVHPNPHVKDKIAYAFDNQDNVILTSPLDYPHLVCLMRHASLILTDSGGIQEEAPSFGVPVLVLRHETERIEGVEAGVSKLVGSDPNRIIAESIAVLDGKSNFSKSSQNPYGDGKAAAKIKHAMDQFFSQMRNKSAP